MSAFIDFIKNLSQSSFLAPLFGSGNGKPKLLNTFENYYSSLFGKMVGTNLTGAEREANEFNAQEAQKQRDWEEQMANSQYQRGVADMRAAGLNTGLLFGSAQPASTPSGAAASSVAPSGGDFASLMQMISLPSQIRKIEAETRKLDTETDMEIPARVEQLLASTGSLKSQIRNTDLDSDSKEIILKYLDEQQDFYTQSLGLGNKEIQQNIAESVARVNNLSEQNKKIVQEIVESRQRVRLLAAQESLTREQVEEVKSTIKQIDAQTEYIKKNTQLTEKDLAWYAANHIIGPASNLAGDIIGLGGRSALRKAAKAPKVKDPYDRLDYQNWR